MTTQPPFHLNLTHDELIYLLQIAKIETGENPMTDTAFQVSAALTGDDAMAHKFLTRAANAIVEASDLGRTCAQLKNSLGDISSAYDILNEQRDSLTKRLEDALATIEQLRKDNADLSSQLVEVKRERDDGINYTSEQAALIYALSNKIETLTTERDDARFEALMITDERDTLQAKLAKFKAISAELFPETEPASLKQIQEAEMSKNKSEAPDGKGPEVTKTPQYGYDAIRF